MSFLFHRKHIIFLFLIILLLTLNFTWAQDNEMVPANIILFIGDGMGVGHVTAAKTVNGSLSMEAFPVMGLFTTHSSDAYVTDSAASGTALATGHKTYNGAISISPQLDTLKTVLEYAEDMFKSTGLVATCRITHATPACFAAHVDDRDKENEIADQLARSGVDVMIGGGLGYFLPSTQPHSYRKDNEDLTALLAQKHPVLTSKEAFLHHPAGNGLYALLMNKDMDENPAKRIPLADMTRKAIEILSRNENGFFLMVEGSQIDWDAHDNQSQWMIQEIIDFDEAVGAGLDFAKKDGRTLVIVTADHETGGYSVLDGSVEERKITKPAFSTGSHSGVMVPLFAFGPGAEQFGGIHDNTFVGKTLIQLVKSDL